MSDLISRQAAIDAVHYEFDECLVWDESGQTTADEVERILDYLPSVDAVPVVRCRDCKYYEETNSRLGICSLTISGAEIDGFCSWGERKGNEAD